MRILRMRRKRRRRRRRRRRKKRRRRKSLWARPKGEGEIYLVFCRVMNVW